MMWRVFLDLLAAARRPLVVVDFETAGLGGAPPVEFAVMIWAPWRKVEDDETTRSMIPHVPPGLTYACVQRVDPGQPIDPGAVAVHGIRDEDVRGVGLPAWNDLEVVGFFRGLEAGDAEESEGPAVWCGHNAHGADLAWSRRWGYLGGEVDAIDTMRLGRRLAKEHPHPLAVDGVTPLGGEFGSHVPAIGWGLDAFSSSLTGMHVALTGARPDGAHGALHDCAATARVLCRMLEMWDTLWPPGRRDVPATANLSALLAALDAPEPGAVSWDGWLAQDTDGALSWRKGKHRGKPPGFDADYAGWVSRLPRSPTGVDGDAWCSQHTADVLKSQVRR
ncbi:MAG TPA: 3'-5' exonuclease [Nannocystis sp.]